MLLLCWFLLLYLLFPLVGLLGGGARTYQVAPLNSRPVAQLILLIFTPPSCVFSHYFSSGFALCFYSIKHARPANSVKILCSSLNFCVRSRTCSPLEAQSTSTENLHSCLLQNSRLNRSPWTGFLFIPLS